MKSSCITTRYATFAEPILENLALTVRGQNDASPDLSAHVHRALER